MTIQVLAANDLTEAQLDAWSSIQQNNSLLFSPFLRPEFTMAVAAVRQDVEVAVQEENGRSTGFFPFQRSRWNVGSPVGVGMNEFQAVIVPEGHAASPEQWVRKARLLCWKFDHILVDQGGFEPHLTTVGDSPYMDLSNGFEAYARARKAAGSSVVAKTRRQTRKLERDMGPLRFELHSNDEAVMDCLLKWKTEHHKLTGVLDVFQFDWIVQLLRRVRDTQTDGFRGCLSVLYAADTPIAVNLGMRTPLAANLWYPTYDRQYSNYSPGMVLFLMLAEALADEGVRRLDFGPGPQLYKKRLMTGSLPVAIGAIDRVGLAGKLRNTWQWTRKRVRNSPIRNTVGLPANMLFRFRKWMAYR